VGLGKPVIWRPLRRRASARQLDHRQWSLRALRRHRVREGQYPLFSRSLDIRPDYIWSLSGGVENLHSSRRGGADGVRPGTRSEIVEQFLARVRARARKEKATMGQLNRRQANAH
jgi:hypothetical protein